MAVGIGIDVAVNAKLTVFVWFGTWLTDGDFLCSDNLRGVFYKLSSTNSSSVACLSNGDRIELLQVFISLYSVTTTKYAMFWFQESISL